MRGLNRGDHIVKVDVKTDQVNDVVGNELKFDSIPSLAKNPLNDILPIVNIIIRGNKKY